MHRSLLALTTLALFALPVVQAGSAQETFVDVNADLTIATDAATLIHIQNAPGDGMAIAASAAHGVYYEFHSVDGAAAEFDDITTCVDQEYATDQQCTVRHPIGSSKQPLREVRIQADLTERYVLQAFRWDGDMGMTAFQSGLRIDNAGRAGMAGGNWGDHVVPGRPDHQSPADYRWFTPRGADDWTMVGNTDRLGRTVLTGNMVLELRGLQVTMQAAGSDGSYDTTDRATGPGREAHGFLRLYLIDARVEILADTGEASWAIEEGVVAVVPGTELGCIGACVTLMRLGEALFQASPDGLVIGQVPVAHRTAPTASTALMPEMVEGSLWPTIVLLAAAAAAMTAWRMTRPPEMPRIEAALGAGQFRRAARWSTRLLRRQPYQESAHLSRAIAWSRAGRPRRVVRALTPFLAKTEPSDGTFHYVLGLAHKDLGDEAQARHYMQEAVHRTPSLLAEIGPDLRPAPRGDAQAYT